MVALAELAAEPYGGVELAGGLEAFGEGVDAEVGGEAGDGADDGLVARPPASPGTRCFGDLGERTGGRDRQRWAAHASPGS